MTDRRTTGETRNCAPASMACGLFRYRAPCRPPARHDRPNDRQVVPAPVRRRGTVKVTLDDIDSAGDQGPSQASARRLLSSARRIATTPVRKMRCRLSSLPIDGYLRFGEQGRGFLDLPRNRVVPRGLVPRSDHAVNQAASALSRSLSLSVMRAMLDGSGQHVHNNRVRQKRRVGQRKLGCS